MRKEQTGDMEGTEALREIAFRLERDRAPVFKVQAFRRAAAVVAYHAFDNAEGSGRFDRYGRVIHRRGPNR